jgi:hypothetical protein
MKNAIIAELRLIRDAHAKRHHYDLDAMAQEWMKLEPWMKKKTHTLYRGKIVPLDSVPVEKKRTAAKANGTGRS